MSQASHIQFGLTLDYEYDVSTEVAVREHVAHMLRKTADLVMKGGTHIQCGCTHCHEEGDVCNETESKVGDWTLQID